MTIKKILFLFLLPSLAFANFQAGKDYEILQGFKKTEQILEFFNYGCPWCYKIAQIWPDNIKIIKVPVVFHQAWQNYAKAFYLLKATRQEQKLGHELFEKIQNKSLKTQSDLMNYLISQGIAKELVTSAYKSSPSIDLKIQQAMQTLRKYNIKAIPAFIIHNKYKTDLAMAKNPQRLIKIVSYLAKKN